MNHRLEPLRCAWYWLDLVLDILRIEELFDVEFFSVGLDYLVVNQSRVSQVPTSMRGE